MGHIGQPRPRRWLGGRDSWRRIILTGIAGGLALAILAVLVSSVCGGGSGSLDEDEPTAIPTAADVGPVADVPTDVPIDTEVPVLDTPAPTATDAPVLEPTATTVATPLPTLPLATETALPPTPEPTVKP
ncbi:MAG: hypothetical protein IIC91_01075 [Chloroflexi bacterium]|nr:hypothetical protein [Chloroflexota bacterium]